MNLADETNSKRWRRKKRERVGGEATSPTTAKRRRDVGSEDAGAERTDRPAATLPGGGAMRHHFPPWAAAAARPRSLERVASDGVRATTAVTSRRHRGVRYISETATENLEDLVTLDPRALANVWLPLICIEVRRRAPCDRHLTAMSKPSSASRCGGARRDDSAARVATTRHASYIYIIIQHLHIYIYVLYMAHGVWRRVASVTACGDASVTKARSRALLATDCCRLVSLAVVRRPVGCCPRDVVRRPLWDRGQGRGHAANCRGDLTGACVDDRSSNNEGEERKRKETNGNKQTQRAGKRKRQKKRRRRRRQRRGKTIAASSCRWAR